MDNISNILPHLTSVQFTKIIDQFGITGYKTLSKNAMVLYYPSQDRNQRKGTLLDLADTISGGVKFVDDGRSGYINTTTKGKIYLKPLRTSGSVLLKPSLFGSGGTKIVDRKISYYGYDQQVITAIDTTKELTEEQKEILRGLVNYVMGRLSKTEMANLLTNLGDNMTLNTIQNDFSEVLGFMGIVQNKLLDVDIPSSSVFLPKAGNFPLIDYIISDKNHEYKIYKVSAKSGPTPNTLKPGDVKKIIDNSQQLSRKWSNSIEYNIISILSDNGWKEGPIKAVQFLRKSGFKRVEWAVDSLIYSDEFRQQAENDLVYISKNDLDFTEIFNDVVVEDEIYYVKFTLNMNADMTWRVIKNNQDKMTPIKKKISFRSKNFVGRKNGDKLGFNV